jgi:prepilin-type processing-associated H-X9-DG protein
MLVESKSECSDIGIWGFDPGSATNKTFGFYVHPNKRMQALYLDGHAKSTKFSQTLGTSQDDQQWSFLKTCLLQDCKKIIDTARKNLSNPTVQAVYN